MVATLQKSIPLSTINAPQTHRFGNFGKFLRRHTSMTECSFFYTYTLRPTTLQEIALHLGYILEVLQNFPE